MVAVLADDDYLLEATVLFHMSDAGVEQVLSEQYRFHWWHGVVLCQFLMDGAADEVPTKDENQFLNLGVVPIALGEQNQLAPECLRPLLCDVGVVLIPHLHSGRLDHFFNVPVGSHHNGGAF